LALGLGLAAFLSEDGGEADLAELTIDTDGEMDMVLHFDTQDTGIACGDTEATLTGETFANRLISGADPIVTVNCN
jgi:hypothetical protein